MLYVLYTIIHVRFCVHLRLAKNTDEIDHCSANLGKLFANQLFIDFLAPVIKQRNNLISLKFQEDLEMNNFREVNEMHLKAKNIPGDSNRSGF